MFVWDKRYIYLYPLVYLIRLVHKFNRIDFVSICCYISRLPFSEYSSKGIQFTNVNIDFLLNPFCIKFVTIYLSDCNLAIMYLYKEIKFKPKPNGL